MLLLVDRNDEPYLPALMIVRLNISGAVMVYVVVSQRVLGIGVALVVFRDVIVSKWPY